MKKVLILGVNGLMLACISYVSVLITWPRHRGASIADYNPNRIPFTGPSKRSNPIGTVATEGW